MQTRRAFYIGGEWALPDGSEMLPVISPNTEEQVGAVPLATSRDMDRAVAAAREAFDHGPWPRMSIAERIEIINRARAYLAEHGKVIAETVTLEMGMPVKRSRGTIDRTLSYIDDAIAAGLQVMKPEIRRDIAGTGLILREPVGVVVAIVPWNGPFLMAIAKIAPALVAGCTAILKPAAETPLDCYFIAEAFQAAGLPPGVLNIVPGTGETGDHLVQHPDVDFVSFTGSSAVGRRIGGLCGERVRRVCLELGGKSAAIILDDADLSVAGPALSAGIFSGSGQACIALSRILAPRSRYDEVVDLMCAKAAQQVIGDSFDDRTTMGPLVSSKQRSRVEGYIQLGLQGGARLAHGGKRPSHLSRGWYVEPTVFADVSNGMRLAQEEIFGPVVAIIPYETEQDALRIANDSIYGLGGAVFTADPHKGVEIAKQVRTGTFAVNAYGHTASVPFGGVKASGIGREHGPEGLEEYLVFKSITIPDAVAADYA